MRLVGLLGLFVTASALAACTADVPPTTAGRFGDETPTRTDDVTAPAPKKKDTAAAVEPAPAATNDDGAARRAPSDAAPPPASSDVTTCQQPRDLGTLAGDADGSTITAQGTCSAWLRVRMLETGTSIFAGAMKLTATLVSPSSADFDLYMHVDKDADVVACGTATDKSELPASRSDIVELTWGEQYTANRESDARPVSIEVRAKKPADCGKGNWVLLLEGNR